MPKALMARTSRHARRLIYGSSSALTVLIAVGTYLFVRGALDQYRQREIPAFVGFTQEVGKFVDQLSAQLIQFADIYEGVRQYSTMPTAGLQEAPAENSSTDATTSDEEIVAGGSVIVAARRSAGRARFVESVDFAREFSAAPIVRRYRADDKQSAYIYDIDRSFLVTFPPLSSGKRFELQSGTEEFIDRLTQDVEIEMRARDSTALEKRRPVWLTSSLPQNVVAQVVMPIFKSGLRQFMVVIELLPGSLRHLSPANPGDNSGDFLLQGETYAVIGLPPTTERSVQLLAQVEANASRLRTATAIPSTFRVGQYYFVTQRIDGPNWIAVHVYGWREILAALKMQVFLGLTALLAVVLGIWSSAIYIDRKVSRPLFSTAERLIESQSFAKAIIDTLPVGIAVFSDETHEKLLENDLASRMTLSGLEAAGEDFYQKAKALIVQVPELEEAHAYHEVEWHHADGRPNFIGVTLASTRFAGRQVTLMGLIDINGRKENERLLLQAKVQAEESSRAKSLFVAIVGHEIRTPLHGAVGYLELLAESDLNHDQSEWLAIARHSFTSMATLVDDLLDYTKIEAGSLTVQALPGCVNDILERCAQGFSAIVAKSGLGLVCRTDVLLDGLCEIDPQRLSQVINNLIGNALRFTASGFISLSCFLTRSATGETVLQIDVVDTGTGVPVDLQASIFQPMYQGGDTVADRHQGSGLGLFVCSTLCRRMGGFVSVTSELGVGSTFSLTLPFKPLQDPSSITLRNMPPVRVVGDDDALVEAVSKRIFGSGVARRDSSEPTDLVVVALTSSTSKEDWRSRFENSRVIVWLLPTGHLQPSVLGNEVEASSLSRESLYGALSVATGQVAMLFQSRLNHDKKASVPRTIDVGAAGLDILIAEDDAVSRGLLIQQLGAMGLRHCRVASDGEEALRLWLERPSSVVITDIQMPRLNGIELAEALRADGRPVVIIGATAAADTPEAADLFDEILRKPVVLDDLRIALRRLKINSRATQFPSDLASEDFRPEASLVAVMKETWIKDRTKLLSALESGDRPALRRQAHRLKGAFLSLGWIVMADELRVLEASSYTLSRDDLTAGFMRFITQFEEWLVSHGA
jgi:two-component system capsular synthesis sensor histidine kinase RcsC